MGVATTRTDDRIFATTGAKQEAQSVFETNESVLNGGVLFALPALISQGLGQAFKTFNPLPNGFYGLKHMLLLLSFMALCRIKSPEELKKHPPGEWGKLLGLDRIPEVGYFRKKIGQIIKQSKVNTLQSQLFEHWTEQLPELYFYIDGHVRVYHGDKANLPKRFVSREKLCLNGTTEFWVNSQDGKPLMVITGELNEKLKVAIIQAIEAIKRDLNLGSSSENEPLFTMIFDREAYEPAWFKSLLKEQHVAVITYRKNVNDKWDKNLFLPYDLSIIKNKVMAQLCEMGTNINGLWFREIRKLSESGHQTAIMTTHPTISIETIAEKMFSRWTQENFFKYMSENFNFDRIIEYGIEDVAQDTTIPNPEYNRINYQLKKAREKRRRLQASIYEKIENKDDLTIEQAIQSLGKGADIFIKIDEYDTLIQDLLNKRKETLTRISIAQMPEDKRYNKLKTESKKLKNIMLMIAYRAETALYNSMSEFYKNNAKDGRMILKEIFTSDADFIPDYQNKTLTVRLHSLSANRFNKIAENLCTLLNETEIKYPDTELTIIYKTV